MCYCFLTPNTPILSIVKTLTMLIKYLLFVGTVLVPFMLFSQNVAVNNDGSAAHPNAMLDIKGINKGLLIPRGDAATRIVLSNNTAKGLMLYDTVQNAIWMHNGNGLFSGWNTLSNGINYWRMFGASGTELQNTNTGGFWSANASPVTIDPGVINAPTTVSGTRLMWMPAKSAFRVGTVTDNSWLDGNIGTWSFAAGYNVMAFGSKSISLGENQVAQGVSSVAIGSFSEALGDRSVALGYDARTTNQYNISIGKSAFTSNFASIAIGDGSSASAFESTAMGYQSSATGDFSVAIGAGLVSKAIYSMAVGRYNDSIATAQNTLDVSTNPVFYVGNGTGHTNRSNAMVVYKNGNMDINGSVDVAANATIAGAAAITGNLDVGGFSQLGTGAPSIKMKKLTATSPAAQGGFTFVNHGVTPSKILSITALITVAQFQILPNHLQTGFQYTLNVDGNNIAIGAVNGNSASILNMPVKILIVYEE